MYTKEQRRELERKYIARKKQRIFTYLGGKCARCGTTENLEIDHVDASMKSFTIASNYNRRWDVLVVELDKCQLLCHDCHLRKTAECGDNNGGGWNKKTEEEIPHGTDTGYTYWKCRCDPCRLARYNYRVHLGDLKGTRGHRGPKKKPGPRSSVESERRTTDANAAGSSPAAGA